MHQLPQLHHVQTYSKLQQIRRFWGQWALKNRGNSYMFSLGLGICYRLYLICTISHACVRTCVRACVRACVRTCVCVCVCRSGSLCDERVRAHVSESAHAHIRVGAHACMHLCLRTQAQAGRHVCAHMQVCELASVFVCVRVCVRACRHACE